MKIVKLLILILLLFVYCQLHSQTIVEPGLVKWYTIEEAMELFKENPKTLYIDVYTDWCGWCKHMMKTTFSNQYIANYLNANFYPVRLNAETKDTIQFMDSTYISKGKNHDLAIKLLNGRMSYPTVVYIDPDSNKFVIPGYQNVKKQEPLLYYFAEGIYKTATYEEFNCFFQFSFPQAFTEELAEMADSLKPDTTGVVKWISFEDAIKKNREEPRKIYLDIYSQRLITCKVMNRISYTYPAVAEYLNTYFYPVRFNAVSKDTITIGETKMMNQSGNPFHQLAIQFAVDNNVLRLPTVVFFDEQLHLVTRLQEFISPGILYPFLKFVEEDAYKTMSWNTYKNKFGGN